MEKGTYTIKDAANMMGVPTSTIRYKCWYYETAIAAGTEKIHLKDQDRPDDSCLK